jgi:hypothetical protein
VPHLLANGGLALTDLSVRMKAGTGWTAAPSYTQNQEYRLTVRLANAYPPVNYGGMATRHVVYLYPLRFVISLPGAAFTSASADSSALLSVDIGAGGIAVDDKHPLQNTRSRTYQVYFRWSAAAGMSTAAGIRINIGGGEVCGLPHMSPVAIRPAG